MGRQRVFDVNCKTLKMVAIASGLFVSALFSPGAQAQTKSPGECYRDADSEWQANADPGALSQVTTRVLFCLSQARPLTSLGMQSLLLFKMSVAVAPSDDSQSPAIDLAPRANPYDPATGPHLVKINFALWKQPRYKLSDLLDFLEAHYFPSILWAGVRDPYLINEFRIPNDPAFIAKAELIQRTFDASLRQHIVAADSPPPGRPEVPGNYYEGALFDSIPHLRILSRRLPFTGIILVAEDQLAQLKNWYVNGFTNCGEQSKCLERMEARVVQGFLMMLGRFDFAQDVYNTTYTRFRERILRRQVGCLGHGQAARYRAAWPEPHAVSRGAFGWRSYLGELMYVQAMDRSQAADPYAGQNALVRSFSQAAFEDFVQMGGFGGLASLMPNRNPQEQVTEDYINRFFPSGASRRMLLYWLRMRQGSRFAEGSPERQRFEAEADSQINTPFFQQTSFFDGKNLKWWVEYLYKYRPGTAYHIWTQDYNFRRSETGNFTLYDRVVDVATHKESYNPQRNIR